MRASSKAKSKKDNTETEEISKCIINISSLLALKGVTGTVTYAASKAGLIGLTRSMVVEAADVLRGGHVFLRCNAILPGYIDTPMIQGLSFTIFTSLECLTPPRFQ